MLVEIIEFYPIAQNDENDTLSGTLRIKIPALGIHILGVFATKKKGMWFFSLPSKKGFDPNTAKDVRYPCIVFECREQQRALIQAIKDIAPSFIENKLAESEKPLFSPEEKVKRSKESSVKPLANAIATTSKPPFSQKVWKDPPPRKFSRR